MRLVLTRDPGKFAARAQTFLSERIERNVLATVLMNVLDGGHTAARPLFAYGVAEDGEVGYAALRTPPRFMLTSELGAPAADRLVPEWLEQDPELPGVGGPADSARAIAAAWSRCTGAPTSVAMREAMHVLDRVHDPPRPARGELRPARPAERSLLVEWMGAFIAEAGLAGTREVEATVDYRLEHGRFLVWDDRGPVSLVGLAPAAGGVARIGPVYTPPDRRRRGYAGTAVAEASRLAIARGAHRCTLFTDVSNPTSNKIYAEVGYHRFGDWEEHEFR
ncbi:MAG: GNAT family N-acetyltransferase [Solirubrobacterales bacterium]|nr:GNAT family N-acetyltransferase [Solirubrobacterales bacterium]